MNSGLAIAARAPERRQKIADYVIWTFFVLFSMKTVAIADKTTPIRLVIYALPLFALLYGVSKPGKIYLNKDIVAALVLMTVACALSMIFSGSFSNAYAEYFFLISAPLCFLVSYKIDNRSMKLLACVVVALWVESLIFAPKGSGMGFDLFETSGMETESTYCFPLAVIAVYFLFSKQYRWALFISLVTFLAFKRSAILGVLLSWGAYMIVSRIHIARRERMALWLSFFVFIGGGLAALSLVTLFEAVDYDGSINALTAGRYHVNQLLVMLLGQSSPIHLLFGHGWGYTTESIASLTRWVQPHNDFFRVVLDQGVVGFCLIMAGWVLVLRSGVYTVPLAVLMATFLPFDNTLIYLHTSLIFVFAANALRQLDEQARQKRFGVSPHFLAGDEAAS